MSRITLLGLCCGHPIDMQIQSHQSLRENLWISREHLSNLIYRNDRHKQGVPYEKHDPASADQIQQHNLNWHRVLRLNHGSHDLGRWICDSGNPDKDHRLGQSIDGTIWTSQHCSHTPGAGTIKLFTAIIYGISNKLECLSLASNSQLV